MPIAHSDRIAGSIFVIASNAEGAGNRALDYLRDKTESYAVFDEKRDAERELYDKFSSYDTDTYRVYEVSLTVQVAD